MAKRIVLGIVGMPASGKSVVAEYLNKRKDAKRIHTGDFINSFLRKRGVNPGHETEMMASLYMWIEFGDIPVVNWVNKQIKAGKAKLIVIDSLRTVEETRQFQAKYKNNFHIVAVATPPDLRLQREKSRARFGKLSNIEFRMRDREELRTGVGDLIANADFYIDASGTEKETKQNVDRLLKLLKIN